MERIFNLCEAALWSVIAVVLAIRAAKARNAERRVLLVLAITFFLFGVSDVIEAQTGAWWQPWWLAVLKVACGITIGMGSWRHHRIRKRR